MAKSLGPIKRKFTPWDDPAAKPFIHFDQVTKRFGDYVAVDDLSLKIYEREFFALLGPSGCGKTTMMRMLAGFEEPTEGAILLEGRNLAGVPPYKRPANMMFQSYALFPHMTVEGNIAFGLKQDKVPKGEIDARVQEMLKLVKLEPFAKRKPHQLSGGQRQRVALARSLVKRPKVLLLDEPLGALDKKLREETQFELMDLQMELGMTFIIVTHDQEEAMTVADRIAVMDKGRIVQVATPSEIYEQPNSRYVADFIGDVNLLEARVARVDGHAIGMDALIPGLSLEAESEDADVAVGAVVGVSLRPEKVRISTEPPANPGVNSVKGTVYDIGYLGDISVYRVHVEGDTIIKATLANTSRLVERPIGWDDEVWVSWSRDAGVVLTK